MDQDEPANFQPGCDCAPGECGTSSCACTKRNPGGKIAYYSVG